MKVLQGGACFPPALQCAGRRVKCCPGIPMAICLLGARPGHGKTLLGLQLLLDAIRAGRRGVFFTLEYTEQETHARIRSLEGEESGLGDPLEIVTSDEICADYIMRHLADACPGTVAVIDYLQILDQRRNKPELSEQNFPSKIRSKDRHYSRFHLPDRPFIQSRGKALAEYAGYTLTQQSRCGAFLKSLLLA